ncbi:DUF2568 domain-containing protein [Nocardioides sp. CER19]|uniref:DUF2568 domain-containing protein n=1 Tax=Nocardioides sp. CER19 TaxID=3038538 RepID=UPI0024495DEA|nr:DUF2568 domain-containing protein [Nocardioides sp. CER19]MDH2414018.1 DUF2568 domain-containing protein [Nocardioides sp. CER19]
MTAFAWIVLGLVFVDELLACAAAGVVGWAMPAPWLFVWLLPLLVVVVWFLFASPKARYGGPVVRPVVKVLVFGLAALGLWAVGHETLAVALLLFSVVVNGLAQLRFVRAAAEDVAGS